MTDPPSSFEQLMTPLASAVSAPPLLNPVQSRVPIFNPPAVRVIPFPNVEVAEPVVLSAETLRPDENVEVAPLVRYVLVALPVPKRICWSVAKRPSKPLVTVIPPEKVDDAESPRMVVVAVAPEVTVVRPPAK